MTPQAMRTGARSGGRDRSIDVARAVAIVGVVGGHWLVTGLVVDDAGGWRQASPLSTMPAFTPLSWFLQTLGLFFFTGGFAAGRPRTRQPRRPAEPGRRWWPPAATKLARPLALLLGGWAVVLTVAGALGLPDTTRRTITVLVISPLWFLLPYLALKAATGVLSRAVDRAGPFLVAAPAVVVVALSDAGLAPAWIAVAAAWSVPWILGIAVARRPGPALPATVLLIGGVAAMIILVRFLGYPAAAVGVPGDGRSNLSPPSLFAVALAGAQIGVFLLLRNRSRRAPSLRSHSRNAATPDRPGRSIAGSLNRAALPIYLAHQSVFVVVVAGASLIGDGKVPGLLTAPAGPQWIIARVAWLPFLALALTALIRVAWWTTRETGRLKSPLSGRLLHGPEDDYDRRR